MKERLNPSHGLEENVRRFWAPPPPLTLSQWAEKYAILSPETSAEPGRWRPYPYQVGMMDAFTDPSVERVTIMKSSRVGYTRMIDHAIGYGIHHDPAPMLIVQPTIEDAEDYSRDELEPMFRDTPVLTPLVADAKARTSDNTIKRKRFPGGQIILIGANAARGFRRITVKRVFFDEVDGYPVKGAGVEGDQIALGSRRTETYDDRLIVLGSTPTIKGFSRIEISFGQSDRRFYFVPCPSCNVMQTLLWENMKWPEGRPDLCKYECPECKERIGHEYKRWMVERGEWRATEPFRGHAGFHIWAAYSYSPNATWPKLAEESEEAKKLPNTHKVFINQVLGQSHEDDGEHPEEGSLLARRERWEGRPDAVLFHTVGVDVQDSRLEIELVGWGVDEESWSLDYKVLWGDPGDGKIWAELDQYLLDKKAAATCIDSGGHHTQTVYKFAAARFKRRVYAIKGQAGSGRPVWPRFVTRVKDGGKLFVIGVDSAKDIVYSRLKLQTQGPGYCHFPYDRQDDWYSGLTCETVVTKYSKGFPVREYRRRPGLRNEPLDCRVYAYAALASFGQVNWKVLSERRRKEIEAARPVAAADPAPMQASASAWRRELARPRSNFITRWKE